ncbi:hypothetical protein QR98_0057020 [Sarcoptes scabiei]|uniref:Uncharacterized protein n=1 Tax=Sarcoptes scabiei TaxID=52283 RepID=A0A132A8D8_SARSC|nr:hypothetical protein QR98_0057020 [Sarcoptes scabiei]
MPRRRNKPTSLATYIPLSSVAGVFTFQPYGNSSIRNDHRIHQHRLHHTREKERIIQVFHEFSRKDQIGMMDFEKKFEDYGGRVVELD